MKLIWIFVILSNIAKGLSQYSYPKPSQAVGSNRPNNGGNGIGQYPYSNGNGNGNGYANGNGNGNDNGNGYGNSNGFGNGNGYRNGNGNGFGNGNGNGYRNGNGNGNGYGNGDDDYQDPEVHKHIYVHVPPPELNNKPKDKLPIKPERPQKHYKIVFIKAPTPPTPSVNIPPPPQIEEKTLVYVLVKKPDEIEDIPLPTPQPTEPSKPEVYFIRYKSKKDEGEDEAENGYDRKIEVVDNEGNEYEKPSYLPPLTQLFSSSAYVNLDDSY